MSKNTARVAPVDDLAFGRQKRQLLAWLALLAPLPLPFSKALEWPVLLAYALILVYFLQRVEQGRTVHLPNWALNLLGLAYLPILAIDLRLAILRGRFVIALLHLIMFLLVVKLFAMRRESEKWHVLVAVFFLFVGGMATSTHLTVSLYLVAFLGLAMVVLARFTHFHIVSGLRRRDGLGSPLEGALPGEASMPRRLPLLVGGALVIALAVPIFAVMPRLHEPFLLGAGGGAGSLIRATGFSDSVDLSLTSSIRGNREVVLRLQYEDPGEAPDELRLKGAVYDRYEDQQWHRLLNHARDLSPLSEGFFSVARAEAVTTVEIFRERLRSAALLLPLEAVSVRLDQMPIDLANQLKLDPGGAVILAYPPRETVRYTVEVAKDPVISATRQEVDRQGSQGQGLVPLLTGLDQTGITRGMRELARQVLGEGSDSERARNLERYLLAEYEYTTNFIGREGDNALDDFLFVHRSGHCELFASAMVLMLRAEGIPARLATGYLGAEYNRLEDYLMVRQDNAHAWVEALTERGWQVFDPTPPEGRPGSVEQSWALLAAQLWDYVNFRWDRYVLTYGAQDQADFFSDLREAVVAFWKERFGDPTAAEGEDQQTAQAGVLDLGQDRRFREDSLWQAGLPLFVLFGIFVFGVAAMVLWQRRRPLSGEAAYARLRSRLARAGLEVRESLAPLELRELAAARFPAVAAPVGRVVGLYLRESFAGEHLPSAERAGLRDELQTIDEAVARARKAARQAPVREP